MPDLLLLGELFLYGCSKSSDVFVMLHADSPAAGSAPWSRTCGSRASWPAACPARWPSPTSEERCTVKRENKNSEALPSGWLSSHVAARERSEHGRRTDPQLQSHLALVQVADDLLEEPLLQLLLGPHALAISRDQVQGAGFVRPLRKEKYQHSA